MDEGAAQPDRDDGGPGEEGRDFIAWAMEGSEPARKLVLAPIIAGVLAALVAYALFFPAGLPVFMDSVPWDLLRGYRCFVLPKHLVFFCVIAAPIASALILLTQPRLRLPANAPGATPPITEHHRIITFVGIGAFVLLVSGFHLFSTGWLLTCRLESTLGVTARYLVSAVIIAVAPAVSIAAVTLAYSFRGRFKFGWAPDEARAAMRPIGMAIAIIALLTIDYAIITHSGHQMHPIAMSLVYMAAGFLVAKGSLTVARLIGWLSAAAIVIAVGDVLSAPLRTPAGLLLAKFRIAPIDSVLTVVMVLVWFGFALWIYQAVRAKPILDARQAAGRTRSPPWTGFACGLLIVAYTVGSTVLMEARFGREARILARQAYGDKYAYQISGVGYGESPNHIFVTLEGYDGKKVFKAQVDWKE
jgi:hypothetical protein